MKLCTNSLSLTECDIKLLYFSRPSQQDRAFYNIGLFLKVRLYYIIKQQLRFENLKLPYWSHRARRQGVRPYFPLLTEASHFLRRYDTYLPLKKRTRRLKLKRISFTTFASVRQLTQNPRVQPFSLKERIFLSHKTIQKTVWEFLYSSARKKKIQRKSPNLPRLLARHPNRDLQKRIFLNAHKPLVWKMRSARYAHWNLKTKGKLNEYRYNKLLGTELHFVGNTKTYLLLPFILFSTLTAFLSWRQIKQVMEFGLFVYNGKYNWLPDQFVVGDIIELPFGFSIKKLSKCIKYKYRMIINKARRATYKNFVARKQFGIRKPIRVPKIFKKLPVVSKYLRDRFAFDPALRCFAVIHPLSTLTRDIERRLTKSSVLTLQNWRYRFD